MNFPHHQRTRSWIQPPGHNLSNHAILLTFNASNPNRGLTPAVPENRLQISCSHSADGHTNSSRPLQQSVLSLRQRSRNRHHLPRMGMDCIACLGSSGYRYRSGDTHAPAAFVGLGRAARWQDRQHRQTRQPARGTRRGIIGFVTRGHDSCHRQPHRVRASPRWPDSKQSIRHLRQRQGCPAGEQGARPISNLKGGESGQPGIAVALAGKLPVNDENGRLGARFLFHCA